MEHLSGMQAFVEVARSGSFVAAAEGLGLSASAVSKSVRRLEEKLGVKLLHRTTRSLSLTSDGELFFERAGRVLSDLQELTDEMSGGEAAFRGGFRLTMPHVLGDNAMMPPLTEFLRRYPHLALEVRFDNRVVDLAEEGIDVAIRTGELKESANVIVTRFFEYQRILCAAPALLQRLGQPATPDELARYPRLHFLMPDRRPIPWRITWQEGSRILEFAPGHTFENLSGMANAAAAGMGVAMLPSWACWDMLRQGDLVELFPETRPERTPVWLAYHQRRHVSARVLRFVEEMKRLGPSLTAKYCLEEDG